MESVIDDFNERVLEIEEYLKLLKLIDMPNAKIDVEGKRPLSVNSVAIKTMKASCFLMLYNLVESSIKGSMVKLYEKMNSEDQRLLDFDTYVKDIWIEQKFRDMDPSSTNQKSYRKLLKSMIEDILEQKPVTLDPEKIPISGNLDAKAIRNLFNKHKIPIRVHYRAFGGGELKTIKDQRNSLAHGSESFAECGKDFTVQTIIDIKKQAVVYLRSSLKNIQKYIEKTQYAA